MDLRIQIRIEETFTGPDMAGIIRQPFCDDISVDPNFLILNWLQTLCFANYSKNMNFKKIVAQGRRAPGEPPISATKHKLEWREK